VDSAGYLNRREYHQPNEKHECDVMNKQLRRIR
jgi:hypothetical protein